jgi:hypothetical protein
MNPSKMNFYATSCPLNEIFGDVICALVKAVILFGIDQRAFYTGDARTTSTDNANFFHFYCFNKKTPNFCVSKKSEFFMLDFSKRRKSKSISHYQR